MDDEPELETASLPRRLNAATIDLLAMLAVGFGIPQVLGLPGRGQIVFLYATFLLLEPALIRVSGSTIGQGVLGLRVVPTHSDRPLTLLRLTLRYWSKIALGGLSLFYILFSHQRLAVHDRLFRTAVLRVPRGEHAPSVAMIRSAEAIPGLPSAPRRFAAFIVWYLVSQIVLGLSLGLCSVAFDLAVYGHLSSEEGPVEAALGYLGSGLLLVITANLAADGRLPGARRQDLLQDA